MANEICCGQVLGVLFVVFTCSGQLTIELFALFHLSVCDYMCFTVMIYRQ